MCGGPGTEKDGKLHNNATWRCDSIEVWRKGKKYMPVELIEEMEQTLCISEAIRAGAGMVITGGEPLLQEPAILEFLECLKARIPQAGSMYLEIETNGTIAPKSENFRRFVDQWNVSPKLANSGEAYFKRYVHYALKWFAEDRDSRFKFVISHLDDMQEVFKMISSLKIPASQIWLMPAASSCGELLQANKMVAEICLQYHFNFSSRLQLEIWDATTGV